MSSDFWVTCTSNCRLVQPTTHYTGTAEICTWRCVKAISAPPTAQQLAYSVRIEGITSHWPSVFVSPAFTCVNPKLDAFWRTLLSQNKAHTFTILCAHYNIWNSWPIPTKLGFLSLEASSPSYLFKFPAVQRDSAQFVMLTSHHRH